METKGKKNGYTCRGCGWRIVTVNRVDGVTPFMIGCQNVAPSDEDRAKAKAAGGIQGQGSKGCGAFMESSFYRIPQHLDPSHEWYSPDKQERRRMRKKKDPNLEHVEKGGLILRRLNMIDTAFFEVKAALEADAKEKCAKCLRTGHTAETCTAPVDVRGGGRFA